MKILVTGSRYWTPNMHAALVERHLIQAWQEACGNRTLMMPRDITIIQGGANGVDAIALKVAIECGFRYHTEFADWEKYGKGAGHIRNRVMLDMEPDLVMAFHHDLYHAKGTLDCYTQAVDRKCRIRLITGPAPV